MATDKIPEKNAIGDIIKFYRPIHTISKMFGYLPFTIESTNGEIKSKIYLIDWLWFISYILFSVFCLGNYLVQLDKVLLNTTSSQVVHFGVPLVTILGFFKMMLSFTLDMINRHRVAQNLQTIREIDEKLQSIGVIIDFKTAWKLIKYALISMISVCSGIFVATVEALRDGVNGLSLFNKIWFFGLNFLYSISYGILSILFIFWLITLKYRFCLINEQIREVYIVKTQKENSSCPFDIFWNKIIETLADAYDNLCDVNNGVNICYSFQIMLSIGFSFSSLILSSYSGYHAYIAPNIEFNVFFIVILLWSVYFALLNIAIFALCSCIEKEGKLTANQIHRVINVCTNKTTIKKLLRFSYQLQHRTPLVHCGFFTFDWKFFYTMIGAFTAYLIISIQFDTVSYRIVTSSMKNTTN